MKSISTYHLINGLLADGKANLYPELEPFDVQKIFDELSERAKKKIQSREDALNWCIEDDSVSENEKNLIKTSMRIYKTEKKAADKLGFD